MDRVKELRHEHKEFIRQKRQEARDAVHVMERSVEVKLAQERERNGTSPPFFASSFDFGFPLTQEKLPGLIILSAYYGLASSFTDRGIIISETVNHEEEEEEKEGEEKIIDVTIPVQALVQDGRVYIPGGKGKHNIIGFYVSFLLFQVDCEQGPKEGGEEAGKDEEKNHDAMLDADLWVFT